ncbi:MAG: hypothetical protein ACFFBD_17800, partial [Candidatus Hodarchaeota archaeon]
MKEKDDLNLFDKTVEDGDFGAITFKVGDYCISRDLMDSINEMYFLNETISLSQIKNINILDIGAGYGRLAHRMLECFHNIQNYFTVDAIPESTLLCQFYLDYRRCDKAKTILLPNIEDVLKTNELTLAI